MGADGTFVGGGVDPQNGSAAAAWMQPKNSERRPGQNRRRRRGVGAAPMSSLQLHSGYPRLAAPDPPPHLQPPRAEGFVGGKSL